MKGTRIVLGSVTLHNIKQLKRLHQVIFPVSYNDKFYRTLGTGTKMLNHVSNICEKRSCDCPKRALDSIYLHVQISNESAVDFYRKFGIEIIETKNCCKRTEPAGAHVLQRNLEVPSGQKAVPPTPNLGVSFTSSAFSKMSCFHTEGQSPENIVYFKRQSSSHTCTLSTHHRHI
uniref:N-alpha-acetyltransferase 50 n=1 Tax=Rhinolophus ferrumequinum TaxID=59479 RepID=A0A671E3Q7_RHIFE